MSEWRSDAGQESPPKRCDPEEPGLILVVEDHDDTRGAVCESLRAEGYRVEEAVNGREALEFLVANQGRTPRLILLDLEMPVMTGMQFLERLRSYRRLSQIPVVIASGSEPAPDPQSLPAIVEVLKKPYDLEQLRARVISCTHRSIPPSTSVR